MKSVNTEQELRKKFMFSCSSGLQLEKEPESFQFIAKSVYFLVTLGELQLGQIFQVPTSS